MKGLLAIANQVAEEKAKRISNVIIKHLQKMPAQLSGDDSGLDNVWDEVCVQMQIEESYNWSTYLETIEAYLVGEIEELKEAEQLALWMQTQEYIDWNTEQYELGESDDPPVWTHDIVRYLINDYILREANDWSNKRIRNYSDSRYV